MHHTALFKYVNFGGNVFGQVTLSWHHITSNNYYYLRVWFFFEKLGGNTNLYTRNHTGH